VPPAALRGCRSGGRGGPEPQALPGGISGGVGMGSPPNAPLLPLDLFGLPDQVSIHGKWLIIIAEEIMETHKALCR
jgi:hypothetical protein